MNFFFGDNFGFKSGRNLINKSFGSHNFTLLPKWLTKAYPIAILQLIALNVASSQKGLYSMQIIKNDENYH